MSSTKSSSITPTTTTTTPHRCASSNNVGYRTCAATLLQRSREQSKSRYYQKLGLLPHSQAHSSLSGPGKRRAASAVAPSSGLISTVSSSSSSSLSPPESPVVSCLLPSCLKQKRSVLHTKSRDRRVTFYEQVKCIYIPSHRCYTDQEHSQIWNSMDTIAQDVERNTFEFWVDGGDWRTATEEEDMYLISCGGGDQQQQQLVHPATWLRLAAAYSNANGQQQQDSIQKQQPLEECSYQGSSYPPHTGSCFPQSLYSFRQEENHRRNHRRRKSWERKANNAISVPMHSNPTWFSAPTSLVTAAAQQHAVLAYHRDYY